MIEITPAAQFIASIIAAVIMIVAGTKVNSSRKASNAKRQSTDDIITGLQTSNTNLNDSIKDLKRELKEVCDERDKANMEIGRIQAQAQDLQAQIKALQGDIDDLRELNRIVANEKAEAIKKNEKQLEEIAQISKDLAEERATIITMSHQIDNLEEKIRAQDGIIRDLTAQLALNRTLEQIVNGIAEKLTTAISEAIRVKSEPQAGERSAAA